MLGALSHPVCVMVKAELVTGVTVAKMEDGASEIRIYSKDGLAAACALGSASPDGLSLLLAGLALGQINHLPWATTVLREPY